MSKKKIYNKHLERGRFYIHSDGHGGHPALLIRRVIRKTFILLLCLHHRQALKELN